MPLIRKIRCSVQEIQDHGNQVYTLTLAPEKEIPAFHPGQFLHLALDEYDSSGFWPDSRAFSIASSPVARNQIKISYSVKGKFTARMQAELFEGKQVWVKLPYGDFVVKNTEHVVLIAGGTGITAFCAFIESLQVDKTREVFLFYGARSENLLIYHEMLTRISQANPNFHLHYALEMEAESDLSKKYPIENGRLAIDWIWNCIPGPLASVYFLSGPPPMLAKFTSDLKARGIADQNIRIDAWE